MRTWVVGRIFPLAVLLIALLTGCTSFEDLPTEADLLPPNYVEKRAPPDFYKELTGNFGKDLAWLRCFDCEYDWEGLNGYLAGKVAKYNYTESTDTWIPYLVQETKLPEADARKLYRVFSSPSMVGHVMVMNIAFVRSVDSSLANTSGDYLILVGYDNSTLQQQH